MHHTQRGQVIPGGEAVSFPTRTRSQLLIAPRQLDFGTIFNGRIQWLSLMVECEKATERVTISPSVPWIEVRPSQFECKCGESRIVNISTKPRGLVGKQNCQLSVVSTTGMETIFITANVEPISPRQFMLMCTINVGAGALLGLFIIGGIGNLVLRLLGRSPSVTIAISGAVAGGVIFTFIGTRVQHTLNLGKALALNTLRGCVVGTIAGGLGGVVMGLLGKGWTWVPISVGLCISTTVLAGIIWTLKWPQAWQG